MAVSKRLKAFLDASKVKYTVARHPVVYTAQEIAAAQHVPGRHLAKCVLVNTDRGAVLAVLPATHLIDFTRLKAALGARTAAIAKESEIQSRFPDVDVGAMPPFGTLYQTPVIADHAVTTADYLVFNAGSHTDTIKMRSQDFLKLATPKLGAFGQPFGKPARAKRSRAAARSRRRPSANAKRGKRSA